MEDQGWVAYFAIQALKRRPLTLYGDGLQVRDILFVEDLAEAMLLAHDQIDKTAGEAFNIGGGPDNTISLLELLDVLGAITGRSPAFDVEPWRPADQKYYVSDVSKFRRATGWRPRVSVWDGVKRLLAWLAGSGRLARPAMALGRIAS
jgi:CDP-paratose 2-epimerase